MLGNLLHNFTGIIQFNSSVAVINVVLAVLINNSKMQRRILYFVLVGLHLCTV